MPCRRRLKRLALLFVAVGTLLGSSSLAAQPDFERDIWPILRRSCVECHGPNKSEADLRLDAREFAIGEIGVNTPTEKHNAIVPGHPEQSEVIRRVRLPEGDAERMPAVGSRLTPQQIQLLERWIANGAVWPTNLTKKKHWAYIVPQRFVPLESSAWTERPFDTFVLARIKDQHAEPAQRAEPNTRLRRLSLDLRGLPPTIGELDEFADAESRLHQADAWDRAVDRFLASPQLGEKWARPWLDAARYADSHGFQRDDLHELWAYRDWVIRALNHDMPFTQFVVEQLAGDLIPGATESQKIATGFHRCATTNVEAGSDPEETRTNQIIDRVNTTGAVFLGTTFECVQCHEHKYDPFPQIDYYRLMAFFNNTEIEADRTNPKVPGSIKFLGPKMALADATVEAKRIELQQQISANQAEINEVVEQIREQRQQIEEQFLRSLGEPKNAPLFYPLAVTSFQSQGGADHRVLEDGSILLTDESPDKDTYSIQGTVEQSKINGIRLEVLTDPSLPGEGPGRRDAARPNFVLNSFVVKQRVGDTWRPVKLVRPTANFSQKGYDVGGAIDDDPKTAWAIAPRFHQPHTAQFGTLAPLVGEDKIELSIQMVQSFGSGRTIGRFRISAVVGQSENEVPGEAVPSAEVIAILTTPEQDRSIDQVTKLVSHLADRDAKTKALRAKLSTLQKQLENLTAPTTLVMRELPQRRETRLFSRGDFRQPGDVVTPGVPEILHPFRAREKNRFTFAEWLTSDENPLLARVTVNRWWSEIFGRGLVGTLEDFGVKGDQPTHPEILDALAVQFVEERYSTKRVLREIVLSSTYQQSSAASKSDYELDPHNELLRRGPRFRLDAEAIRDNALAIAGIVSHKQFGPPIRPPQPEGLWTKIGGDKVDYIVSEGEDRYRRGVYVVWKRGSPYPSFLNFDATARMACKLKRSRANTPLQALTLLNDTVYVEASRALAARIVNELPNADTRERIRTAWRWSTARLPNEQEVSLIVELFESQRQAGDETSTKSSQLPPLPPGVALRAAISPAEFRAWEAVATTLLNLDETITKE